MDVAASAILGVEAGSLLSHRFPIERASDAYLLADEHPEDCLQILLTYT